jgi:hypothetical protein
LVDGNFESKEQKMSVDLSGGLDRMRDLMFAERPENPEMRDSVSFWVYDDQGQIALPRVAIEAISERWEAHGIYFNLTFADGRAYRVRADGEAWPVADELGSPSVLGAGPLSFRCVEPFRRWSMTFEGEAVETSTTDLLQGRTDGPLVEISVRVDATMAVPPWTRGGISAEARAMLEGDTRNLLGGQKHEQLFRATGAARTPHGEASFTGSGLRIRRNGVRKFSRRRAHCWQSALFPSGRGFGYLILDNGEPPHFTEGFIYDGEGDLIPAQVVEAPWLTKSDLSPENATGQDVSFVFDTPRGRVRIEGESLLCSYDIARSDPSMFDSRKINAENSNLPPLQQAGARYRWDGEETIGMLERSHLDAR